MWIVACGNEEGNVKTNLVAVRSTFATEVNVLEWHKTIDGTYRSKLTKKQRDNGTERRDVNAISRVLVVEVTLKQPWSGRTTVKIANIHLHYMTEKGDGKFKACSQRGWAGFRRVIERWDIDIVAGDMALWIVVPTLRKTRVVALVSTYAFLPATSTVAIAEGK